MVVIAWLLNLQLSVQLVPITTKVASLKENEIQMKGHLNDGKQENKMD
jgi:hypothetical protein